MIREDLQIGKYYSNGGEPIYKLVDIGVDWILVIHYSTVHYVANAEFFKLEEFLEDFYEDDDDWNDDVFDNELIYSNWQTLKNNTREY